MKRSTRTFETPDGVKWGIEVRSPSASNAMVVFAYPDAESSRRNRYSWYQWEGDEANVVTARLDPRTVMDRLSDADLKLLFRRSMPIYTDRSG